MLHLVQEAIGSCLVQHCNDPVWFAKLYLHQEQISSLINSYGAFSAGTAAVTVAGVMTSCRMTNRKLSEHKFLFQGAGEVQYSFILVDLYFGVYVKIIFAMFAVFSLVNLYGIINILILSLSKELQVLLCYADENHGVIIWIIIIDRQH